MTNLPPDASPPPDPDDRSGEPAYSEADWQSLIDYLSGEGSPEVRSKIEQRLANDPAFADFAAPVILAWQSPVSQPQWDWDTNWAAIQRKAAATHSSSQRRGVAAWGRGLMQSPVRWRSAQWATVACIIVAAFVTRVAVRAIVSPRYLYQGGLTGVTVRLPDSSIAALAPGSYLGTDYGFPKTTRTVYLFGDAHFTIVHSSRIPFIVQVPGASARVLGTTFRMQVDTTFHVRVDVTNGSVAIETCDSAGHWHQVNVLTAGQAIHVPMLAVWMSQAGYTVGGTGMPIREAARIEEALRRAAIHLGAAAAAHKK